jgi:hypothetical protein
MIKKYRKELSVKIRANPWLIGLSSGTNPAIDAALNLRPN